MGKYQAFDRNFPENLQFKCRYSGLLAEQAGGKGRGRLKEALAQSLGKPDTLPTNTIKLRSDVDLRLAVSTILLC